MTSYGLPEYTPDDRFDADGGAQLVRTAEGDPAEYRARIEGGFVRYRWYGVGDGTGGYWTAESPDGVTRYYGADHEGNLVDEATMPGPNGASFRYHLVDVVDRFGHVAHYEYEVSGGFPYLSRISWIYTDGNPKAQVTFDYEARDDQLSDARSGAIELRARRLAAVNVTSNGTRIWRYVLTYQPYDQAGGLSRIARIQRLGVHQTPYPVVFDFEYSKTLGDVCDQGCEQPYLVDMGSLGVNLQAGSATLIDINGDALPDVVDTSVQGAHRFFINHFTDKTHHTFDAPRASAVGTRASHQYGSPYVQTFDANGDGRSDLINVRTGDVLFNLGTGDWANESALGDVQQLPDFTDGFGSNGEDDDRIRFLDYDNDRKVDVIRSTIDHTYVYRNEGMAGFVPADGVDAIGAAFVDQRLDLADMNGDGLQDPVLIEPNQLSYRLNLGRGHWSAWRHIPNLPIPEALIDDVELEDINGDSLADVVTVLPNEVRYALNRGADRFDAAQSISRAGGTAIPTRDATTTVLFADMNGSGSDDIVWITAQGEVTYLELFPLRPNLMTKVTNGLGLETDVTYSTSVEQLAADPDGWTYKLPFALQMVRSIDTYDSLNAVHQRTTYTYHDAYYDTEEKQWRGFAHVELLAEGDDTQQSGVTVQDYDVGASDRYRAGKLLTSQVYALDGEQRVPLQSETHTWTDCPVAGIPAADQLQYPIRYVCQTALENVLQEGADSSQWVTTRTETTYDGYGNVAQAAEMGVIRVGNGGCGACQHPAGSFGEPCGAQCTGDENYVTTTYVTPDHADGHWILGKIATQRHASQANANDYAETRYYYDGDAYVGLPLGSLTAGLVSRTEIRTGGNDYLTTARYAYDADGNQTDALDPRGDPGRPGFKVHDTYDADHLLITRAEHEMVDPDGHAYVLRRDYEYDPLWGEITAFTGWITVQNGQEVTPRNWTRMTYDDLGLRTARAEPGDDMSTPTTQYEYDYGDPVSRVVTKQRSTTGGALDREISSCLDGFGREVMSYRQVKSGQYEANEFRVFNKRGQVAFLRHGFDSDSNECARSAPEIAPLATVYDALGRELSTTHPDAELYGSASTTRIERAPLTEIAYDVEDTDSTSPYANTPAIRKFDGIGRLVSVEYVKAAGQPGQKWSFEYDQRGYLTAVTDPGGNRRVDTRDFAGHITQSDDPDRGTTRFEYDGAGNETRREDAAGHVVRTTWDAMNRPVERWDDDDRDHTLVQMFYDLPGQCPDNACPEAAGQRTGVTFPLGAGRGEEWYTHDARGNMTGMRKVVDGVAFDFQIERDNLGLEKALVLPDGTRLAYTRDGVGRVTAIDGYVDQATYALGDQIATLRLHNGTEGTWTYDTLDRVANETVTGPDGPIVDLTYTRSRKGLLMSVDDASGGSPNIGAEFTYDALDRLTRAVLDPGGQREETLDYAYDDIDNLVRKVSSLGAQSPSHVGDLTYGHGAGPHALTLAGQVEYAYDEAGELTRRGDLDLAWDAMGRPVSAKRGDDTVARFTYSFDDDRVLTEEGAHFRYTFSPQFEIEDGMAIVNVRLGDVHVATHESDALAAKVLSDVAPADGDGHLTAQPDGHIDAGDAVVAARVAAGQASIDGTVSPVDRLLQAAARRTLLDGSARTTFNHHDYYRNVIAVTDDHGRVIERRAYDPHGLERTTSAETSLGYNGKRTDRSTGLVFFGARYYDPNVGRWISPDPAFDVIDPKAAPQRPMEVTGTYIYDMNNPIFMEDPLGRTGEPIDLATYAKHLQLIDSLGDSTSINDLATRPEVTHILDRIHNATNDLESLAEHFESEASKMQQTRQENVEFAQHYLNHQDPKVVTEANNLLSENLEPSQEELDATRSAHEVRKNAELLKSKGNELRNAVKAYKRFNEITQNRSNNLNHGGGSINPLDRLDLPNGGNTRSRSKAMQVEKQLSHAQPPKHLHTEVKESKNVVNIKITTSKE
jgi:RHS repeat-associated protein